MSTPLKATSSLLRSRLSPRSPRTKFLTPSPAKPNSKQPAIDVEKSPKNDYLKNTLPKINIFNEFNRQENLILDSPHRRSLLNYGLSKCDLLYLIGKGSFGTVVKGEYKGEFVALKLVKLENPSQILNENNARFLVHENIIKIMDIIVSEKYGLVIMEYYKNSINLQQLLDDNIMLDEKIIIGRMRDVATGLSYCHKNDVLHLDIKPNNVLLCNNNICKICDFGNSMKEPVEGQIFRHHGTVAYTAPEILKGKKPSAKCDIYSLGMLIWQLITRKTPYESLDNEVVIYKVVKFDFRPSLEFMNNELSNLCSRCWKADPSIRPNALQVCNALTGIIIGSLKIA